MTAPQPQPGSALMVPPDIMSDLLKAQAGSITTSQSLPSIVVMAAGVGLFEFPEEKRTSNDFRGVILNMHPRNVLWEREIGTAATTDNTEDAKMPACSSNDGVHGRPRKGFAHAGLPNGEVGDGEKSVACATCPYNKWGTGNLFIARKKGKGKAVTNQRAVYVLLEGKEIPYRLVLAPSSLRPFDEYLTMLLSRSMPVQAVLTHFTQEKKDNAGQKYAEVRFNMVETLTQDQFNRVITKRKEWDKSITPTAEPVAIQATASVATEGLDDFPAALEDKEDDLPF